MLAERASYSISMMARVLGVSRSGFYRWVKAGSPEDPWGPLKEAIAAIWEESGRRFGFRKVWSKLTGDPKYGRFAGTTLYRVRKCMSGPGMRGICPNASRRAAVPDRDAPVRPGPMGRDFPGPVPATEPVGGMACLRTTGGFIYLAVAMDLCTRMAASWRLRDSMGAGLVAAAPGMARSRGHVAGGAIFRSDRGSQHAGAELAAWAAPPRAPDGCIHDEAQGDRIHRVILQPLPSARIHRGPRAGRGHAGVLRPLRECPPGRSGSHAGSIEICDSAVHYIDRAHLEVRDSLRRDELWAAAKGCGRSYEEVLATVMALKGR